MRTACRHIFDSRCCWRHALPRHGRRVPWRKLPRNFFGQKTIKFMITYEPGGTYDLYAGWRTIHLPKHMPGHPRW